MKQMSHGSDRAEYRTTESEEGQKRRNNEDFDKIQGVDKTQNLTVHSIKVSPSKLLCILFARHFS